MGEDAVKVRELLMSETLPKKNYFKLSEVAVLLGIKSHEIHYWESEFPQIRSQKLHGQRVFRKEDIVLFSAIKHLLYDRKFTVAGARRVLAESDMMSEELASAKKADTTPMVDMSTEQNKKDADLLEVSDVLMEASHLLKLDEEDVYDEQAHEIYQDCAKELEEERVDTIESHCAGEMLSDALIERREKAKQEQRLREIEKERAMAMLLASKKSLTDVIASLDKIAPSDFWRGF